MPKAILEFNLPEEDNEYQLASNALKLSCALWDITQKLREWDKYGVATDRPPFATVENTLEYIRQEVADIISGYDVSNLINA